jgi:hypothetical protein
MFFVTIYIKITNRNTFQSLQDHHQGEYMYVIYLFIKQHVKLL